MIKQSQINEEVSKSDVRPSLYNAHRKLRGGVESRGDGCGGCGGEGGNEGCGGGEGEGEGGGSIGGFSRSSCFARGTSRRCHCCFFRRRRCSQRYPRVDCIGVDYYNKQASTARRASDGTRSGTRGGES